MTLPPESEAADPRGTRGPAEDGAPGQAAHAQDTGPLADALAYARLGFHVFPCRPDKAPHTARGFKDATTDPETIRAMWSEWPSAQVGDALAASGHVVVDLDRGHANGADGIASFRALELEHGDAPREHVASTPAGGEHLFFAAPTGSRIGRHCGIRPGVDLLGDGYAILPSAASPGRAWTGSDPRDGVELLELPAWIAGLAPTRETATHSAAPLVELPPDERAQCETRSALYAIPASVGRQTWLSLIYATHAAAEGAAWGRGLVEQWSATTTRGGQYVPGEAEDIYDAARRPHAMTDRTPVDRETLYALAARYGWSTLPCGIDVDFGAEPTPATEPPATTPPSDAPTAPPAPAAPSAPTPPADTIACRPWDVVAALPPLAEQVAGLWPTESVVILAAEPSAGKTTAALSIAYAMVHGRAWLGRRVMPGSVIYCAGEGFAGLAGRFRALRAHHAHEIGPDDAQGRYFAVLDGVRPVSAKDKGSGLVALLDRVVEQGEHPPALVVLDTLNHALDGDENSAQDVGAFVRAASWVRKRFHCSVLILHHLAKPTREPGAAKRPVGIDRMRGSSALRGNADVVLLMSGEGTAVRVLAPAKAKDFAIDEPVRFHLHVVETGVRRVDGSPETACVPLAAVELPESLATPTDEREAARARVEADGMARLLAAFARVGATGFRSRDEAAAAAGVRATSARAWITLALADGRLASTGTAKLPRYVLAEFAHVAGGGGDPPPHPPSGRDGQDGEGRPSRPPSRDGDGTARTARTAKQKNRTRKTDAEADA